MRPSKRYPAFFDSPSKRHWPSEGRLWLLNDDRGFDNASSSRAVTYLDPEVRVSDIPGLTDKSSSPTNSIPACGFFVREPEPFLVFD